MDSSNGEEDMLLTDHPEELALYKGVVANPLDNAPRLIMADWYLENGYEWRSDHIRSCVEGTKQTSHSYGKAIEYAAKERFRIENEIGLPEFHIQFDRGFVNLIALNFGMWIIEKDWLLSNYPLTKVFLDYTPKYVLANHLSILEPDKPYLKFHLR